MARFSPDYDIVDSLIHAVYRYKTGEIDDDGNPVYRPMAFQTDAEDVTLIYSDFNLTTFNVEDEASSKNAFANAVRNFETRVNEDIAAGKMDLFQLLQYVVDSLRVNSKMAVSSYDVPTKVSQLLNDAGYVTAEGTINKASRATADEDGNNIKSTYATKAQLQEAVPKSVGSANTFVYTDANGKITASNYTIETSVPAGAVFTDTTYSVFGKSGPNAAEGLVPKPPTTTGSTRYLREDGVWVVPNDSDDKVTSVATDPTAATTWYPISSVTISNETYTTVKNSGFKITTQKGTTGLEGKNELSLGNTTATGTNGNMTGRLNLFNDKGKYTLISPHIGDTTDRIIYTPKASGTLVLGTTDAETGSAVRPVYISANGVATQCTYLLNTTVPADAKFTDTTYDVFVGSGSSAASGLVPKPPTTAGTSKYLREDGSWAIVPVADVNVTSTSTNPASATTWYPIASTTISNETNTTVKNEGFRITTQIGTTSVEGLNELNLGNNKTSGIAGNLTGRLSLFNNIGKSHWIIPHIGDDTNRTLYTPKANGTLVVHTTDTEVGSALRPVYISANGVATQCTYLLNTTVPANAKFTDTTYTDFVGSGSSAASGLVPKPPTTAGTTKFLREDGSWAIVPYDDIKVTSTATNPSTSAIWYPVASTTASTETNTIVKNEGFKVITQTGTTSAEGVNELSLGNNKSTGTAGNLTGKVGMYNNGGKYHQIVPHISDTADRTIYTPKASGTMVVHTTDTAIGSEHKPVYVSADGAVTAFNFEIWVTD